MYAPVHAPSAVSHGVLRNSLEGPGTGFQILEGRPEIHRGLVSLGIRSPCATSVATALEPGACKACLEELLDPDLEAFSPATSLLPGLPSLAERKWARQHFFWLCSATFAPPDKSPAGEALAFRS